ncbi:MAG: type I DNA topoisomerase [Pseudomonadota bacterium]
MNIVIVESAAKAKTINKYLGSNYKVIASYGHVRDLPSKDGSVEPENDFEMHWNVDSKSDKILKDIANSLKGADKLILATDPDREGEAISWHILEVLQKKKVLKNIEIERVAFNAVTKNAIKEALNHPREIDTPLVSAYLARRALDYLVGFTLSPVLWRKLPGSRSAGRVQSVALRLVCQRELEIEVFQSQEYWTIDALLSKSSGKDFAAKLHKVAGKRLGKFDIPNEENATKIKTAIQSSAYKVASIESKPQKRHPSPPFTTSTLQQEASRKLGFNARQTMQVAQRLYEGIDIGGETQGLITYMRTDGVQIIPEAMHACRSVISKNYGAQYVPEKPRAYKTKAKNAQEAHEAVRPTDLSRLPKDVQSYLQQDQFKLYNLIWMRTIASQMESAEFLRTTADIDVTGNDDVIYTLRATGSVLKFDGFLKLYQEGRDDSQDGEDDKRLPALEVGESVNEKQIDATQHFTEPPPRYTEATLVKKMEELGIGRPSTYASTLSVLQDRDYVRIDQKRLIPEDKGRLVIAFLEGFFERYVQYDFTAGLEEKLDLISDNKLQWKEVLRDFWLHFTGSVNDIKDLRISEVLDALNEILGPHIFPETEKGVDPRKCPACDDGQIGLKVGRFGAFVGCTNYPECKYTRQFTQNGDGDANALTSDRELGMHPETGFPIMVKNGRFGPYIELSQEDEEEKPKRASIPKGVNPNDVELEYALKLLALPRTVGKHPETNKDILSGFGRYGPYIQHERTYVNLPEPEDVFTIELNRAVILIAEKPATRGRQQATPLKDLGEHPQLGGPIHVMKGRYGPYIKHGKINATLPASIEPEALNIDDAVRLIAEKAEKSGAKKKKTTKAKAKTTKSKAKTTKTTKAKSETKTKTAEPKDKKTTARKTTRKKTTKKTAKAET